MNDDDPGFERVLDFWLGQLDPDGMAVDSVSERWWKKDPRLDTEIRSRFERDRDALLRGDRDDWLVTPRGRLAAIIVLDQFSRNMYRGTPEMFSGDTLALRLAAEMIERREDQELKRDERVFVYMPFMHAEDLGAQRRCVELFEELASEAEGRFEKRLLSNAEFARAHHDIIARFGRFPHRNQVLGRPSTPEELEFLKQKNSSF